MKKKRLLSMALCAAMILSLSACGDSAANSNSSTELSEITSSAETLLDNGRYSNINVALAQDPENLEPKDSNNIGRNSFLYNIYEALFDIDDNGAFVPSLGKDINIVDDTTYDITLYDSIYDSDGNHITADDVVYSVNWFVNSGNSIKYELFDSVEALDDYTVEFHWAKAPSALSDLEFPLARTFIFSQKAWDDGNFSTSPVATGSYTVKDFVSGSKLILEANDDYWALKDDSIMNERMDLHRANVQTITYEVISESSQAAIALEQKTVDYCDYITSTSLPAFQDGGEYAGQFYVNTEMAGDFYTLTPNGLSPVMDDVNLRKAIWYAIDNNAVAQVMGGSFTPLYAIGTTFFSDYVDSWEKDPNYMNTYDPDLAKEYLEKSNYNGQTIKLISQSSEAEKNALTMIQTLLSQVGINAEVNAVEASIQKTTTAGADGWDISLGVCGGLTLVGVYNRLYSNTVNTVDGKGLTLGMLDDPKLQSLYETASADATHDDEHMSDLNDYVLDNAYMYALVGTSSSRVYSKNMTSLYFRENNVINFGPTQYLDQDNPHSSPTVILDKLDTKPSGYTYTADDGTVYILNVASDKSWTLYVNDDVYTGDMSFEGDSPDILITTPPAEGIPAQADFFADDGVCQWRIEDDNTMHPLSLE